MPRLFLDDDLNRHREFARRYPGELQTTSLVVAQNELRNTPGLISELWLDHDLGTQLTGQAFFDPQSGELVGDVLESTVAPLVDWLCASGAVDRALPIIIHSFNVPASLRMKTQLEAAGFRNVRRQPFSVAALWENV
jgi:hypothetical protein